MFLCSLCVVVNNSSISQLRLNVDAFYQIFFPSAFIYSVQCSIQFYIADRARYEGFLSTREEKCDLVLHVQSGLLVTFYPPVMPLIAAA